MLDDARQRVALELLDENELLLALQLNRENRVGLPFGGQEDLVRIKGNVDGIGAVPIDDGGRAAVAAKLAGRALSEGLAAIDLDFV